MLSNSKMDSMHRLAPLPPPCCGTKCRCWNWWFWTVFPCLEGWRMVDYGGEGAAEIKKAIESAESSLKDFMFGSKTQPQESKIEKLGATGAKKHT
ncbi:S ribonuclease [Pyrus ussuriensis x Pyrus communis]|uniref:S ribonuclease n=1 Tax=Pyrus ussuriensis x Pyrus communis TaxID=2448454 RepID=A0A5N5F282_9ROSA|nr:S ribonuclease [Pyrus ussuriensis x Pyrus communis]